MKKISIILILLVLMIIPQRTQAQKVNWVALESDTSTISTPGQLVIVTLNASLNVPLASAAFVLRYDPACFRVTSHHFGNLLAGATSAVTAQPGLFDLTYQLPNKQQGNIGEGSLMRIQLETLKLCTSDLSVSSNSMVLKILDAKGSLVNLPGVEYHTLSIHLTENPRLAATATPIVSPAPIFTLPPMMDSTYVFLLTLALLPIAGTIISMLLLRRKAKKPTKRSSDSGEILQENKIPALVQAGQSIPLTQSRTRLGRHTEIIQRGTGFYLTDTGNQQGTLLNGNHIGRGYYFLHDGDHVQLGNEGAYRFVKPRKQHIT